MAWERFRWAFCQLDTLRRCMPSSIRKALNELPVTLDDTYERALQEIPKEKWQHAHRLFQCLIAAIRPLFVEELAEIFAIEFDPDAAPRIMEGFRPENPEEAILSACSTLIAVINDDGSKTVQFSHFSVKEYLTSDRLRTSEIGTIRRHHIPLDAAHTILARACLTELLQLGEIVDNERLATFPLVSYAAWHWVYHAKFEGVSSRIQDILERLFDPTKSYLASWTRLHNVDPKPLVRRRYRMGTALYYAVLCGFNALAHFLIISHSEDANAKCGYQGSPLHAALYNGDLDTARLLLDHGADANLGDHVGKTPFVTACEIGDLEAMQLLLEHGADVGVHHNVFGSVLHHASYYGRAEVVNLLLRHNGNVNARDQSNQTPLHLASSNGHSKVVELLLDYGADVDALSRGPLRLLSRSPLHKASRNGHLEVVRILLAHGANVHIRGRDNQTTVEIATSNGHIEVAELLLRHGAETE